MSSLKHTNAVYLSTNRYQLTHCWNVQIKLKYLIRSLIKMYELYLEKFVIILYVMTTIEVWKLQRCEWQYKHIDIFKYLEIELKKIWECIVTDMSETRNTFEVFSFLFFFIKAIHWASAHSP